jgi:mannose-6-phosphate isomerase-like protein (cupin superfamily)
VVAAPAPAPALAATTQPAASSAAPVDDALARRERARWTAIASAPPGGRPSEYDPMVEALRARMVELHGPMDMTAVAIDRIGDWAWLSAQPYRPGQSADSVDPVSGLMRKVDGRWKLLRIASHEDSDEARASWKRLPRDFPDAPKALFSDAARASAPKRPTLNAQLGATHVSIPLEDLAKVQLAPGQTFKIEELGRDEHSSHHIVALLDREPLHRHDEHDLLVVVLQGEGEMLIGETTVPIGRHSIVYVPRRAVHSMHNTTKKPLIGYAVFTPPFDGKDRVPVP